VTKSREGRENVRRFVLALRYDILSQSFIKDSITYLNTTPVQLTSIDMSIIQKGLKYFAMLHLLLTP